MSAWEQDRETWLGYVARMEEEFHEHAGYGAQVWRMSWQGLGDFERAFRGPWTQIREYVTTEFREWIEEYDVERVTISEWRERQRAEREAEKNSFEDWLALQPF